MGQIGAILGFVWGGEGEAPEACDYVSYAARGDPAGEAWGSEASPPAPLLEEGGVEPQRPLEVGPRGKLRPMRDTRRRGKHGKRRLVVPQDPRGPLVAEQPTTQPQTPEEIEAFLAGLDERLKRMRELEAGGAASR